MDREFAGVLVSAYRRVRMMRAEAELAHGGCGQWRVVAVRHTLRHSKAISLQRWGAEKSPSKAKDPLEQF